jgi:hypothetical protein
MATRGIVFEGRKILIPGAYGYGEPLNPVEFNAVALNVVCLVGTSKGGEPHKPTYFGIGSQDSAHRMYRGGNLPVAARAAWNPSPDEKFKGADVICFMRVNRAIAASRVLSNADSVEVIKVIDRDWGEHGNGTQVGITAGKFDASLRRVKIKKTTDGIDLTSPDLGKVFRLAYSGNGGATAQVQDYTDTLTFLDIRYNGDATGVTARVKLKDGSTTDKELVIDVTGATDGGVDTTFDLVHANFDTLEELAAAIDAITGFNATVLPGGVGQASNLLNLTSAQVVPLANASALTLSADMESGRELVVTVTPAGGAVEHDGSASFTVRLGTKGVETVEKLAEYIDSQSYFNVSVLGSNGMPSSHLDDLAATTITSEGIELRAINGAIVDYLNRFGAIVKGELLVTGVNPVAASGLVSLTGGSEGPPPTIADWKAAFARLMNEHVYFVVPCTDDELIIQAALDHVVTARDIKVKRRRQLFCGAALDDVNFSNPLLTTIEGLKNRIFDINSSAASCFAPGVYVEVDGEEVLKSSWVLAAAAAGMKGGGKPQMSLTYKYFRFLGLQGDFDPTAEEEVITAGASYMVKVPNKGYQLRVSQTTNLRTGVPFYSEPSMIHVADTILTDLELTLGDRFTGVPPEKNVKIILNQIKSDTEYVLKKYQDEGALVGNDDVPGYKVTRVSYLPNERRYHVELQAEIGVPGNYITIKAGWTTTAASV